MLDSNLPTLVYIQQPHEKCSSIILKQKLKRDKIPQTAIKCVGTRIQKQDFNLCAILSI